MGDALDIIVKKMNLFGKQLSEKCTDEEHMSVFMMLIFVGLLLVLYHGHKFLKLLKMEELN